MTKPDEKKVSFEQALERLEQIVSQIEGGQVPLEESIEKYAEGMALLKTCRAILASAEKKIQVLAKGEGQALAVEGEIEPLEEA
ncbi:MAG: exodeoxyribonuclease VII small subunit [Planctomycetota bacterium]|nr:exodeoxyribonuclease VII small subunit [Planctomycetota bacterium]